MGWYCNDEDIDADTERSHTNESAGIIAASRAFHANFEVDDGEHRSRGDTLI
jgi:hypothetical protein